MIWLIYKFEDMPTKIGGMNSFQVFVRFPSASGVQEKTAVRFCGYQIGRVARVEPPKILKDDRTGQFYYQALVVLNIDKTHNQIPVNVDVKLMSRGLGSSYIEFKSQPFDVQDPNTKFMVDGTPLQGSAGMTSEFFPEESQKKLDGLVDGLISLIDNANNIIGDKGNKENFRAVLVNISQAADQATQTLKELQNFSKTGTVTLKKADSKIDEIVVATVNTTGELTKTVIELRLILEKINSGQGTAGRFVNDGKLYENLLENTDQLQLLLKELMPVIKKLKKKGVTLF